MLKQTQEYKDRSAQIKDKLENYYPAYEKELLNKYLEYKGNIRVFVRSRPILPIDYKAYDGSKESFEKIEQSTKVYGDNQIELEITPEGKGCDDKKAAQHMFFYDHVFGPDKNQGDIYEEVQHLV